jgi:hypothetical protein
VTVATPAIRPVRPHTISAPRPPAAKRAVSPVGTIAGRSRAHATATFGPRTGIEGCAERGHGQEYVTRIELTMRRSADGELTVTHAQDRHLSTPGIF